MIRHHKTWVFWLNYCLLQWFTVRLVRVIDLDKQRGTWRVWYGVKPRTGWQKCFKFWGWSNGR